MARTRKPIPEAKPAEAPAVSDGYDEYCAAELAKGVARTASDPACHGALVATVFAQRIGLENGATVLPDVNVLAEDLRAAAEQVKGGNLGKCEAMLSGQAHALQAIFSDLAYRAAFNVQKNLPAAETYLRLALKAQSQCRSTIETLAEMKNPRPVAFVKQANIANGPQQVNNSEPRAGEIDNQQNKLGASAHELRQDSGAPPLACRVDPPVEAVAEVDRPADRSGKVRRIA